MTSLIGNLFYTASAFITQILLTHPPLLLLLFLWQNTQIGSFAQPKSHRTVLLHDIAQARNDLEEALRAHEEIVGNETDVDETCH